MLDLFATGQLGIECLSRGAAEAVFIDENTAAVKIVKENPQDLRLHGGGLAAGCAGLSAALRGGSTSFSSIRLYDSGLYESVLETINSVDILSDGGIILCESRREKTLPDMHARTERRKSITTAG